ncbi:hypothetical protein PFISCL1PPCAC_19017, partial [Pristionchus fissidentatus]
FRMVRCSFFIVFLILPIQGDILEGITDNYYAEMRELLALTSVEEVADEVVDDLMEEFPQLAIDDLNELYGLKLEFAEFLDARQMKQLKIMTGFPYAYVYLPYFMDKVREIAMEKASGEDDQQKSANLYMKYLLQIKPIIVISGRNVKTYKQRNFHRAEVDKEVAEKRNRLLKLWNSRDKTKFPTIKEDL